METSEHMGKIALITGVAGQDGGHLAQLLNTKGYEVHGIIRGQTEGSHPRYQQIQEEMPFPVWIRMEREWER